MPGPARAGALIYAKDLGLLTHFYRTLLQMDIRSQEAGFVVMENHDIQLLIHAIPESIACDIVIQVPPILREEGAIKLFFTVPSLAWAEAKAADLGGGLLPQQWSGPGLVLRNAFDPEGNILQLRELLTTPDPL
ncbi:glyoxalase/bleomycin resistance/dioxygenase family protein [Aeromonas salmonicida]|uniref:VOC family protein n=1 Tax=Aeromonas salmonicida TaxID=645 RepID=UPI00259E0550|nr:VOC family protein [Aeromonas salmonicida]MDM5065535.1 glyoxalase/bleomycin resistance/dioxygenase family protein [Aeromonas salmonicida]